MQNTFSLTRTTDRLPLSVFRVLVADDSIALRKFLLTALQTTGFTISEAEDGLSAFNKANEQNFDLIITDHNMPKVNGVQLVQKLRQLPQYKTTPILILTVETNDELKDQARAAGATGWIVKPVHPDTIIALVKRLLLPGEAAAS